MRKLLLLICAITIASIGYAQQPNRFEDQKAYINEKSEDGTAQSQKSTDRVSYGRRGGGFVPTVVWSEDFANGIPAGWENNGTVNGANKSLWEYRGPNTNPDTTVGTRGLYGLNRRIESPTRSNGWVIFDSDYWDNEGIQGNDGNGPVPSPHFGELITSSIDLSAEPAVRLEMYQYFRYFASYTDVLFSIDDGATWLPDTLHFNEDIERNASNDADDFVSANVTSWIGGYANVKIRFLFHTFTLSNGLAGYYFWQLDDIRLIRNPDNDLVMSDIAIDQAVTDGFYPFIPLAQASPTTFRALSSNLGAKDQPNTESKVDVVGPNNHTESSAKATLEVDSSRIDDLMTPLQINKMGMYDCTFSVKSDSTKPDREYMPENNEMTRSFQVTDSVFSVDGDIATGSLGTGSFTGAADDYRMANLIEVQNSDTITSVYVGIRASRTVPGGTIKVSIRDTTGGDYTTDFPLIVCESDFLTVTNIDTALGYMIIPIPEILNGTPQNRVLKPGWYYVSVEMYSSNNNNDIYIWDDGTVDQVWWASIIYVPGDRWYSNGIAFHIRANFGRTEGEPIGIENIDADVSINPNPANDIVHLDLSSETAANFHVVITNIAGQVMRQQRFDNTANISTNIDIADLSSGIYFVNISNGEKMITEKLVINR